MIGQVSTSPLPGMGRKMWTVSSADQEKKSKKRAATPLEYATRNMGATLRRASKDAFRKRTLSTRDRKKGTLA